MLSVRSYFHMTDTLSIDVHVFAIYIYIYIYILFDIFLNKQRSILLAEVGES